MRGRSRSKGPAALRHTSRCGRDVPSSHSAADRLAHVATAGSPSGTVRAQAAMVSRVCGLMPGSSHTARELELYDQQELPGGRVVLHRRMTATHIGEAVEGRKAGPRGKERASRPRTALPSPPFTPHRLGLPPYAGQITPGHTRSLGHPQSRPELAVEQSAVRVIRPRRSRPKCSPNVGACDACSRERFCNAVSHHLHARRTDRFS